MISSAEPMAWCVVQVTLFTLTGSLVYLMLRRHARLQENIPIRCMAIVTALTLLALFPWPSWSWIDRLDFGYASMPLVADFNKSKAVRFEPTETQEHSVVMFEDDMPIRTGQPVESVNPSVSSKIAESRERFFWRTALVGVVGFASLVGLVRLLFAYREILLRMRQSQPIDDFPLMAEAKKIGDNLGITRSILLRESAENTMPATVGWRRPIILLPATWRHWSPEQRRAVLAHELAHVAKHDFAKWLAVQLPLVLHSYHPLVHWLARQVRWQQELAADRRAIEVLGDKHGYLGALAELALQRDDRSRYSLAATSSQLFRRLEMLRSKTAPFDKKASLSGRGLLLISLCTVGLAVSGFRGNDPTAVAEEIYSSTQTNDPPRIAATEPQQLPRARIQVRNRDHVSVVAYLLVTQSGDPEAASDKSTAAAKKAHAFVEAQLALLRSSLVIDKALSREEIADLSLIKKIENAADWIDSRLTITRQKNTDILKIALECPKEHREEGGRIVNALLDAYFEVANKSHRKATDEVRGILRKHLKEVTRELQAKMEEYAKLVERLGGKASDAHGNMAKLFLSHLAQVRAEQAKLESQQLQLEVIIEEQAVDITSEQKVKKRFYERRLVQLKDQYDELIERLEGLNHSSAGLISLYSEVEQLRAVQNEIQQRLLKYELPSEISQPQIQIIQSAVAR